MATSGTFTFDPSNADIIDEAYERIGVDPSELTSRHIRTAIRSINLMFGSWATTGPRQWLIEQKVQTLTTGLVTYDMPSGAIDVLSMVQRSVESTGNFDRRMFRISREDYLAIADKTLVGDPSQFFVDRERLIPVIFVWNAPENSTDQIIYDYLRRAEDAGGLSDTPEVPYRWADAMSAGVAARLYPKSYARSSGMYDSQEHSDLKIDAALALKMARAEDRDRTPTRIKVSFDRRYRR